MVLGAGLVAAIVVVLAVEVQWARNGPTLSNQDGFAQGGVINPVTGTSPVRIVWLGDSTAAGVGATAADHAMPTVVARALGRPVELKVFATSGARISDVLETQVPEVVALPPDEKPDIVLVSVGANDVTHLTSSNSFRNAYLGVLAQLPTSASVIALGVPDMGAIPRFAQPLRWLAGWRGNTLDAVVENMRDHGADYVNIADFTGPAFTADPGRYFAADEFHPNDAGYALWSQTVVPVLEWRLYKREHPSSPEPLQPKEAKGTVKGSAP